MPRMKPERREARRSEIVAAARRCFSRDGFHQTSMPDIAAEAGLSTGAPYRYFSSKEEIILEIAGQAFALLFDPIRNVSGLERGLTVADVVASAVDPMRGELTLDASGEPVPIAELFRCAVQAWGELLRHQGLHDRAQAGFDGVRTAIAAALRHSQQAGTVPDALDADAASRVIMALTHGFLLQRVAFGLDDTDDFLPAVYAVLNTSGPRAGS